MNNWFGKLLGGGLGLAFGGPWGAALGAALGHSVDQATEHYFSQDTQNVQHQFFVTVFSVMGHLAKSDGRVSEREVATAEGIMQRMQLSSDARRLAVSEFNSGKQTGFRLNARLNAFRLVCPRNHQLHLLMLEILMEAAFADAQIAPQAEKILARVCASLQIQKNEYQRIYRGFEQRTKEKFQDHSSYEILGINEESDEQTIKRAYRRLMSKNHPDKLISKGLPPELIEMAKRRTAEISTAYDRIRKKKGFS